MKDLKIMPSALRKLADEIQSPDDIPAMCLRDAADMIESLHSALNGVHPFVMEDYYPNCVTPEFDAAVKCMNAALGLPTPT